MVRLVDLKECIMLYQYIDLFIALPFESAYFDFAMVSKGCTTEGCNRRHWVHQFIYVWYIGEETKARVGAGVMRSDLVPAPGFYFGLQFPS